MLTVVLFVPRSGSSTLAGCATVLSSDVSAAAVTCAIMTSTATRRAGQERRQAAQHGY